ncbi:glycerophosphodiester phosphodiesterase [Quadrisphaera sp. RL12-1S]|nr:glycerophosphodiester phosphodiesterase [Quadrisphaera sp. RL12-1S]
MVMVSAHRPADLEAVRAAAALGVDFVELDVQRCRDGVLVLAHDAWVLDGRRRVLLSDLTHAELVRLRPRSTTTVAECLEVLGGRARAHVDLKLTSPPELYARPADTWEVAAVRQVVEAVGDGRAVITSDVPASVRAVRAWARAHGHEDLLVGLSLGADPPAPLWRRGLRLAVELLAPGRPLRACDATLVVANKALARLTAARWARRHDLPLLVWTVDDDRELVRWLRSGAWLVATNRPARALALR